MIKESKALLVHGIGRRGMIQKSIESLEMYIEN